jgi:hypothetical protein
MAFQRIVSPLVGLLLLPPAVAFSQTPDAAPATATAAPADVAAPVASAAAPPAPPTASTAVRPAAHRGKGNASSLALPGFETMGDGSTRLFVELSRPVTYDTKVSGVSGVSGSTITYVLKGARAGRRNNTNPLVTVHFNTPVTSARLVPHGHDLWFVVQLRAKVQPAVTMDAAKDGTVVMRIEMPKGDYLPAGAQTGDAKAASPAPGTASSASSDP